MVKAVARGPLGPLAVTPQPADQTPCADSADLQLPLPPGWVCRSAAGRGGPLASRLSTWRAASPSGQRALGSHQGQGWSGSPATIASSWRNPVPAAAKGASRRRSTAATARRRCLAGANALVLGTSPSGLLFNDVRLRGARAGMNRARLRHRQLRLLQVERVCRTTSTPTADADGEQSQGTRQHRPGRGATSCAKAGFALLLMHPAAFASASGAVFLGTPADLVGPIQPDFLGLTPGEPFVDLPTPSPRLRARS